MANIINFSLLISSCKYLSNPSQLVEYNINQIHLSFPCIRQRALRGRTSFVSKFLKLHLITQAPCCRFSYSPSDEQLLFLLQICGMLWLFALLPLINHSHATSNPQQCELFCLRTILWWLVYYSTSCVSYLSEHLKGRLKATCP